MARLRRPSSAPPVSTTQPVVRSGPAPTTGGPAVIPPGFNPPTPGRTPGAIWGSSPAPYNVPPSPRTSQPPPAVTPYQTDWGGGNQQQQQRQVNDARSIGAPLPLGVEPTKWYDPTKGTSNKYTGLGILAGGGSIADILQNPAFKGWSAVAGSDDKIKGADGSVYDVKNGQTGQPQWTAISGPAWDKNGIPGVNSLGVSGNLANNGIKGDYAAANSKAAAANKAAGKSTFGYAILPGEGQQQQPPPVQNQASLPPAAQQPAPTNPWTGYGTNEGVNRLNDPLSLGVNNSLLQLMQGNNQENTNRRLESITESMNRGRNSELKNMQAIMADRGLLSAPGAVSGAEIGAYNNLENQIAPAYSQAIRDTLSDSYNTNQQIQLGATQAGTQHQNMLAQVALDSLSQNMAWSQFLAEFGLKKEQVMYEMENGNLGMVLPLIQMFAQQAQSTQKGYV